MATQQSDLDTIVQDGQTYTELVPKSNIDLYSLRPNSDIENFSDSSGVVYSSSSFRRMVERKRDIFTSSPRWNIAQAINYCFQNFESGLKGRLINVFIGLGNEAITKYIESKQGKGELNRLRLLSEMENFKDHEGNAIYSGHHFPTSNGKWTLASIIDYCLDGRHSIKKQQLLEAIKKIKDTDVVEYLESKGINNQLERLRSITEIESFRDNCSLPIYPPHTLSAAIRSNSIFVNSPRWNLKQMIGYCFNGTPNDKKEEFIDLLKSFKNADVKKYIEHKEGYGKLYRSRRYGEIEQIRNDSGVPIFHIHGLFRMVRNNLLVTSNTRWNLAGMIDYCLEGKQTSNKVSFIEAVRKMNDVELNAYLDKKLVSVSEVIHHEGFLSTLNEAQLAGIAIAYLMEGTNSKTFLSKDYSVNSSYTLMDNLSQINGLLRKNALDDFWKTVQKLSPESASMQRLDLDEIPDNYKQIVRSLGEGFLASELWLMDLIYSVGKPPLTLPHAFTTPIKEETNFHRKTRYQLLEVITLSRFPKLYKKDIVEKLRHIDSTKLRENDLSAYHRARRIFLPNAS